MSSPSFRGRRSRRDGGPPTILDVARRAGVSKSAVSRVLRGAPGASRASHDAVLKAAEALGYRLNAMARSLVQRRTYNVGVMLSDLHNIFFAEVLDGINAVADEQGYRMLITTGDRDPNHEMRALEGLLELRADGIILAGARLAPIAIGKAASAVPVAAIGIPVRIAGVDVVGDDDRLGATLAVEHLAALGHRRIAHIDGGGGAGAAERRHGYETTMRALGLGRFVQVAPGEFTEEGGYVGAQRLLRGDGRPTAIFAANDLAALGALKALEEADLRVPEDISLVGYDNTSLAGLRQISLTTIHQPRRQIGEMAMRALLRRIDRPAARARQVVLPPTLVTRATTAPPPDGRPRRRTDVRKPSR